MSVCISEFDEPASFLEGGGREERNGINRCALLYHKSVKVKYYSHLVLHQLKCINRELYQFSSILLLS